jgi:uncharacterized membrane protein YphA (DoxX/SURF4 family)
MTAATASASDVRPSKGLHYGLWVVQVLLAAAFVGAGLMKLTSPIAEMAAKMNWVNHTPAGLVRFIGASEFTGALGLIFPAATRIKAFLTPVAATALVLVMAMAAAFHLYLGEAQMMMPSLVLGALAAFVAWGRFTRAPIASR